MIVNEEINKIINWIEMSYTRLNYKEELLLVNYIKQLQQENARLKDKIEKSIMYIKNTYDDVVSSFTEDKPMTNFKARKELLEILEEN